MSARPAPLPCGLIAGVLCVGLAGGAAWAQDHGHQHAVDHGHAHGQHAEEPPDSPDDPHAAGHGHDGHAPPGEHVGHDEHRMSHDHAMEAPQQPREPIPALTDADRAAAFPALRHHMLHPSDINFQVLFDRFEWQDADADSAFSWENTSWIGSDLNRLWIRSEGERMAGSTRSADVELLYGHSVGPWWDLVGGIRHDFNPGRSRTWAAVGIQGLAPYWFEVAATAYLGEGGHFAAKVEIEYELLLTNRLILQPVLELELHGKDDPARGIGSGLSSAEAGLRLRYEITRRFAPYVGVTAERLYGDTARMHRQAGGSDGETRLVAGVRWWF